jgi:hypothetical protein
VRGEEVLTTDQQCIFRHGCVNIGACRAVNKCWGPEVEIEMKQKVLKPQNNVEDALELDMRLYGQCYSKRVDGKTVRVSPQEVHITKDGPRDGTGKLLDARWKS